MIFSNSAMAVGGVVSRRGLFGAFVLPTVISRPFNHLRKHIFELIELKTASLNIYFLLFDRDFNTFNF